jgi:dTDP-4-dehydrorhamnose reductase
MSILIVGARGMLGSDLLTSLGDASRVIGTDIEDCDITDREKTLEAIAALRPNWVINAAAYTQVDRCEEEKELAFAVNGEGAANLALACKAVQARLIHVSTDYVFDGTSRIPYREDDPVNPLSVYGQSKLQGESAVRALLDDVTIVRTAGLYGKGGVNFVNTIRRLAEERDELTVVDDQWVSPTYSVDLGRAIGLLMRASAQGIFHVVNSGACTWYQFACRIVQWTGSRSTVTPITSTQLKRPAARPAFSVLSTRKYTEVTGGELRSWEDALTDYLS